MTSRRYLSAFTIAALAAVTDIAPAQGQQQSSSRIPRSVLERYVGEYDQDGNIIKILVSGDTLIREVRAQRIALAPLSETLFRMGGMFTAEFVVDEVGGVTQIISNGMGIEFRIRRKGSPPPPRAEAAPPEPAVSVPRAVLERYVGTYEYVAGQMSRTDLRIAIRLEGDALVREGAGPKAILTPVSENRFRVGSTAAMVEFVVDEAGVTQILGAGFQQALARLTSKP
jgi:hypothetical protein